NVQAIARFAGRDDEHEQLRIEAFEVLGEWADPSDRERITYMWRPLPARDAAAAREAIDRLLGRVLASAPRPVQLAAVAAAGQLRAKQTIAQLHAVAVDPKQFPKLRAASLEALEQLQDPNLVEAARTALQSMDGELRSAGLDVLSKLDPAKAAPMLE